MQPESSALSPTTPTEHTLDQQTPSTQHGLQRNDDDGAGPLSSDPPVDGSGAGPATSVPSSEQIAADAAFAASLQGQLGDLRGDTSRRLSIDRKPSKANSTPSPPNGGVRITEYENASTPPVRKQHGPGFEVIKKTRSPGDKRSAIQELPNGRLEVI